MGIFNIEAGQLIWLMAIALPAHVVFVLLSRRYHPLFLVAAVFVVVAPFSQAREAASVIVALKWARIYCTALLPAIGLYLLLSRGLGFGRSSTLFLIFLFVYGFGSFWSEHMGPALAYKSNTVMLMLGGVLLGLTIRDIEELHRGIHVLLFGITIWAIFLLVAMAGGGFGVGRFQAYGVNPNGIAGFSSIGFIIAMAVALYDDRAFFKVLAYSLMVVLFISVVLTGSRAGFGTLAVGAVVLLAPLTRRPLTFLGVAVVISITGWVLADLLFSAEGAERLLEAPTNTREGEWSYAWEKFIEAPIIGHGWLSRISPLSGGHIAFHTHSMYLQVMVDVGLLGFSLFVLSILSLLWQWLRLFMNVRGSPTVLRGSVYLGIALLMATLGLGSFESAPLGASNAAALSFSFAFGLADRLKTLVFRQSYSAASPVQDSFGIDETTITWTR